MAATYQFGIEEELFLADAGTRETPRDARAFHKQLHDQMPEVERELLEAQVEIMTPPCDFTAARASLHGQREGWRVSAVSTTSWCWPAAPIRPRNGVNSGRPKRSATTRSQMTCSCSPDATSSAGCTSMSRSHTPNGAST